MATIQLDTASTDDAAPDLELATDELKAAAAAVRHWEAELAQRVADAQALDSWWMVVWTQLTGTRDEKLESAVRAVAVVQHNLEGARAALEKARSGRKDAVDRRDAKLTEEFERIAELEEVAARIRSQGGPLADQLLDNELEAEQLGARHRALVEACSAASGVVASANQVARRAGHASEHARGDAMGVPLAGVLEIVDMHKMRQHQADYVERLQRLQEALDELGVSFLAGGTEKLPSWLAEFGWQAGGNGMDWVRANRHAAQAQSFTSMADDARMLADHLRQEAAGTKARLDLLADERERLLNIARA